MGNGKEYKNPSRRYRYRNQRQRFLIVCEGGKTEPNYFKSFRLSSTTIEVKGTGYNTLSLVKEAIRLRDIAKKSYHQVWCVFDRDSFPAQHFNSAFTLAERENIKIAYSNEAFELWYLLHFHYFNTGISRDQYKGKLSASLGHKYIKNSETIYDEISDKQDKAIRNAEKLLSEPINYKEKRGNPSTTVHLLVQQLNRFL